MRTASHWGEFGRRKADGQRQGGLSRMLRSVPAVLEMPCSASGLSFFLLLLNGNYEKTTSSQGLPLSGFYLSGTFESFYNSPYCFGN